MNLKAEFPGGHFRVKVEAEGGGGTTLTKKSRHPTGSQRSVMLLPTNVEGKILNQFAIGRTGLMNIGNVFLSSASNKSTLAQPAIRASRELSTTCSMRDK